MKKTIQILTVCLLIFSLLAGIPASPVQAAGVVSYSTPHTTLVGGERFTVSVNVDATPGLFGVQFSLTYDNTLLDVVEVGAGSVWPGSSFASSSFTSGGSPTEKIKFYATLMNPTDPTLTVGAGTLATILFQAKPVASQQTTSIANSTVLPLVFSNKNGSQITSVTPPSALDITIALPASVKGTVTLQAPASRLVTVSVANASAQNSANYVSSASGAAFDLAVPVASDYTLTATALCHLSAKRTDTSSSSPVEGYNTTLLAGDVNGDNTINIQDLSLIASKFGTTGDSSCANINGDTGGYVNILDLSLVASNYGKSGPIGW